MTAVAAGAPSSGRRGWLDRMVARTGSLRAAAVLRALMGLVVIRHLWPDLRAPVTPVERFHVPWWSWLPVPSPAAYRALVWLGVAAGLAMLLGVVARAATGVALAVVAYLLFVDMTGFAHNRGFLVWLLVGLTLLPGAHRLVPRPAPPAGLSTSDLTGPLWPLYLLRVVVASVYLTSGLTKLANPDWRSGLVLWDRMVRQADSIPVGGWLQDAVTSRAFHAVLSPSAIAVELFLGLGLWHRRTRLAAVWVALVFHGSIELAASVQTFSWSAIAALLIWVTPSTRDRTIVEGSPRLRRAVRWLDWLHRFDVTGPESPGGVLVLIDRDGTVRRGRDALLTTLSRLPVLFPVVAPALAVHRLRDQRRAPSPPVPAPVSRAGS